MRFVFSTETFEQGFVFLQNGLAGTAIASVLRDAEKYLATPESVTPLIPKEFPEARHAAGVALAARYTMGLAMVAQLRRDELSLRHGDGMTYAAKDRFGKTPDVTFGWQMNAHGVCYNFHVDVPEEVLATLREKFRALGWTMHPEGAEGPF